MQYLTLKKECEAKKTNDSFTLKMKKIEYVSQQHHVFYERVHIIMQLFYLLGFVFITTTCFVSNHLGSHILTLVEISQNVTTLFATTCDL
jgi:hypothetical protein